MASLSLNEKAMLGTPVWNSSANSIHEAWTNTELQQKARHVQRLLSEPAFAEALSSAETWLKDAWAVEADAQKREECYRQLQGLRLLTAMLQKIVVDAAMEARKG